MAKVPTAPEMAQVAIIAAREEGQAAADLVSRIYASLHKMKRSYIRSFIPLVERLGEVLLYPQEIPRALGLALAQRLDDWRARQTQSVADTVED